MAETQTETETPDAGIAKPTTITTTTTTTTTTSSSLSRVLSVPTNFLSSVLNFGNEDASKVTTNTISTTNPTSNPLQAASSKRSSFLSSILPASASTTAAATPTPSHDGDSAMFAEPELHSNSDEGSRGGSGDDECGARSKLKKSNKPKTSYSICHPPRRSTAQKLHRRPRSVMQLHRLSTTPDARPRPAFEILSSTKATTRVFKGRHGQCPGDLVVLKAEKYSATDVDEEQEADGDIIALICNGRKDDGLAKICFPDGREWEASPTANCGYEFVTMDEHGLPITVRWVPKKRKDGSKPSADAADRRFNFSTISPNSRRHPVIATLCKTSLDINDTFKIPEPSAATPLSTPVQSATLLNDALDEESGGAGGGKEWCETDDRLREIITMTAIWIAFKEGWSPFFNAKSDDNNKDAISLQRSPSLASPSPSRSATFTAAAAAGGTPLTSPPTSPFLPPSSPGLLEKRPSIRSTTSALSRRGSYFAKKANRLSTSSVPADITANSPTTPTPTTPTTNGVAEASPAAADAATTGRTRANSASTVLVHRAASNRAKNHQYHQRQQSSNSASWRGEMLSQQQHGHLRASRHEHEHEMEMREQPSKEDLFGLTVRSKSDGEVSLTSASPTTATVQNGADTSPRVRQVGSPVDNVRGVAREERRKSVPKLQLQSQAPVQKVQHRRETTPTSCGTTSASELDQKAVRKSVGGRKKRRGVLRRLLCGGGAADEDA